MSTGKNMTILGKEETEVKGGKYDISELKSEG